MRPLPLCQGQRSPTVKLIRVLGYPLCDSADPVGAQTRFHPGSANFNVADAEHGACGVQILESPIEMRKCRSRLIASSQSRSTFQIDQGPVYHAGNTHHGEVHSRARSELMCPTPRCDDVCVATQISLDPVGPTRVRARRLLPWLLPGTCQRPPSL